MGGFSGYSAVHERAMSPLEARSLNSRRRRLLGHARGAVLDVGGGIGAHLAFYPPAVTSVTIVGPDPVSLALLRPRAAAATMAVDLTDGPIDHLDATYDTVVTSFAACGVDDLDRFVAALRRRLAPEGTLLFVEHAPAPALVRRAAGRLWAAVPGGCHLDRDLVATLRRGGLPVRDLERFTLPTVLLPIRSCVAGAAGHAPAPGGT